jgi:hypothetical protein
VRLNAERVFKTRIDDQTVVLDAHDSSYLTVNAAGAVILDLLSHDTSLDDVARDLGDRYGLPPERAMADCRSFLAQLEDRGWLEPGDDDGSPSAS